MKLRWKMLASIALTILCLNLALLVISRHFFLESFLELDEKAALQSLHGVLNLLEGDISELGRDAADEASWDATASFIENGDRKYVDSDMVGLDELRLNLALFIDTAGRVVYGNAYDLEGGGERTPSQALLDFMTSDGRLWSHADPESRQEGILLTPEGPMLFASRPILTSEGEGPVRGALILGRILSRDVVDRLAAKTSVPLSLRRVTRPLEGPPSSDLYVRPLDGGTLSGTALLRDMKGVPILALETKMPRDIYRRGHETICYFLLWSLLASLVVGLLSYRVLVKLISSRRELEEGEERFRSIFENAAIGIITQSPEGKILQANAASCQLLGYAESELLDLGVLDVIHPEDREDGRRLLAEVRAGSRRRSDHEKRFLRPDGSTVWGQVTTAWLGDGGSKPLYGVSLVEDITERKWTDRIRRGIVKGISAQTGQAYFQFLVRHLAETLEVDYAFIAEIVPERPGTVRTLALWAHGEIVDNVEYLLAGTPCDIALNEGVCLCPGGVVEAFPEDPLLLQMGAESYVGAPLLDSEGRVRGLVSVLDGKPMPEVRQAESLLQFFALRAAGEMERKQTDERLRESEERYRQLFEGNKAVELLIDPADGCIVDANRAAALYYGYSVPELKTMKISDINSLSQEELDGEMRKAAGERRDHFFFRHRLASGEVRDVEVRSGPIVMKERLLLYSIIHDITERKEAEKALRRSKDRFQKLYREFEALLDGIPDSLVLLSPEKRVIWANKGTATELGRDLAELPGESCHGLWHGRSEPCAECPVVKSFVSGKTEEGTDNTPDGKVWGVKTFPLVDGAGKVVSVIRLASDITEKIKTQADRMRTGQLASLGELAAGVAHEINNPINGIINYAQILANRIDGASRENDIARRIVKEGDRIAVIVGNLLAFARDRGEARGAVAVREVLADSLALVEAQLRKDGARLEVEIPSDLLPLFAVKQQIQQVFLNVLSNARYALNEKYPDPHEDKVLEIRFGNIDLKGRPFVRGVFFDRGTGIPSEKVEGVLKPFYSTKPADKGTGLGLSISHGIVDDHGGELRIGSVEGHFTRVVVDLPAAE